MGSIELATGLISVLRGERSQDVDRVLEDSGGRSQNNVQPGVLLVTVCNATVFSIE